MGRSGAVFGHFTQVGIGALAAADDGDNEDMIKTTAPIVALLYILHGGTTRFPIGIDHDINLNARHTTKFGHNFTFLNYAHKKHAHRYFVGNDAF